MQGIEKRLANLEAHIARAWRWVWRDTGESLEAALERAGATPNEGVLVFTWKDGNSEVDTNDQY